MKLLERILLQRMMPIILEENGIPHHTQTAYQKGVSCSDATEVVQEAIRCYIDNGCDAFQGVYDLEKAFDSVEYCVLLHHLFKAGINGKAWRLIDAFYDCPKAKVRINGRYSEPFGVERGVKQGSVLSPMIFLLVIDALLVELEQKNEGILMYGI